VFHLNVLFTFYSFIYIAWLDKKEKAKATSEQFCYGNHFLYIIDHKKAPTKQPCELSALIAQLFLINKKSMTTKQPSSVELKFYSRAFFAVKRAPLLMNAIYRGSSPLLLYASRRESIFIKLL